MATVGTETGKRLFRKRLLTWFAEHKRDLPWRKDRDPYRVWLSEIMLQQTRVVAVIDHYRRFLQRFPTIERLAAARDASVLAAWSGLGYYRRARMLHLAAKKIVKEHGGRFPGTADALRVLPGIGRYTSAAIASIAFDQPVAVVDGNVERVLQRVRGKCLSEHSLWREAEALLSQQRPGDFNQAMMELGATVCLPRQPRCLLCPVAGLCATQGELPSVQPTKSQRKRDIHYLFDSRDGSIFLVQRPKAAALMPGMWELPEVASNGNHQTWMNLRHSITVTDYRVGVVRGAVPQEMKGKWVGKSRLATLPLTGLTKKILKAAEARSRK
jgi:A/G-specific adenine glycosylase